jgi:SAM-dependent methyltransferase
MKSQVFPPSSAPAHYDQLLAEHYDWMFGMSVERKVAEQRALLNEIAGRAGSDDLAVDLGCGSGFQSLALSGLGYRVLALDISDMLLATLAARIEARSITIRRGDIRNLDDYVAPASVSLAVCMGDTVTHLASHQEADALFQSVARALKPRGLFVATYRDLSGRELQGLDRFIPIRGDDGRTMICFLEYNSPETVVVNDLIYIRDADGLWALHKSNYQKLRLSLEWVRRRLEAAGLSIVLQRTDGIVTLAAVKTRSHSLKEC